MPLQPGTRFGAYEVVSALGAGGMGEVYRAIDHNLKRQVALKVLAAPVADDPDRLARFQREAELLAALNHPHIAHVHGLEKSAGTTALVMELVEGEDLAQHIARGPIPFDEALPIARQIAEALEAAHEQGIIHRDLKPANIKVRADRTVKVLDFGLAKALDGSGRSGGSGESGHNAALNSPTMTSPAMTQAGLILGTAAYMSPEQAKGRAVDKRTDIWAFGCVLYEMLTGHRAFDGDDVTDFLVAIVTKEPDWTRLPAETPAGFVRLLKRCLTKDARQRLRDIGDARHELESNGGNQSEAAQPPVSRAAPGRARWFVAGAAVTAAAFSVAWVAMQARVTTPMPSPLARFAIAIPDGQELIGLDLSADGKQLVFVTGPNKTQLYHRSLDRLEVRPIPGTEGANAPFFSPDGQWVGFFADDKLKKVALRGGAPITICDVRGFAQGVGAGSWVADTIVFSANPAVGLTRVSSAGGKPEVLTTPARASEEIGHIWPVALPGGQGIVFTVLSREGFHLAALSLANRQWHRLGPSGKVPRYLPTRHLLFADSDSLLAVPFDPDRLAVTGTAVPLLDGLGNLVAFGQPTVFFAVSANGSLAYVPNALSKSKLVAVDRTGNVTTLKDEGANEYTYPRVSPDGRKLVVGSDNAQLWIYDLEGGTRSRLTNDSLNYSAVWSADGSRIAYASYVAGSVDILSRPADLSAPATVLLSRENRKYPIAWTADDRLLFQEVSTATGGDIRVVDLKTQTIADIAATAADERNARLSPDARWVSYESNETGRFEVFVRPFGRPGGAIPVSTQGGNDPVWSPKGDELFYFDGKSLVAARVVTTPSFVVQSSVKLFNAPYEFGRIAGANYDITTDGKRFIMKPLPQVRPMQITLALNWAQEIDRIAPATRPE